MTQRLVKLNLGPGEHPAPPPWLNIDSRRIPGLQLLGDVGRLPVRDGSVAALYAGHILEHIPLDALRSVLDEWRRVLHRGGSLMVVGPDMDRAIATNQPQWLLDSIAAHGEIPTGHAWTCTEDVLVPHLRAAGWDVQSLDVATVTPPAWPNPAPHGVWQLAVQCWAL